MVTPQHALEYHGRVVRIFVSYSEDPGFKCRHEGGYVDWGGGDFCGVRAQSEMNANFKPDININCFY